MTAPGRLGRNGPWGDRYPKAGSKPVACRGRAAAPTPKRRRARVQPSPVSSEQQQTRPPWEGPPPFWNLGKHQKSHDANLKSATIRRSGHPIASHCAAPGLGGVIWERRARETLGR